MVRCFLIHTVCPVSALSAGETRVLYSRVFGPDEAVLCEQHRELSSEDRRLLQKEKISVVARQVWSAVSLSREASGRLLVDPAPGQEAAAVQDADSGVMRLRAGDPFTGETVVLWLGVHSLAFTLVCEPHENLLLAEGTLRNLSLHCLESLHMLGPGSEVLLKSSRIDVLLSRLLPHGQLLFLNHRFTQSLEKDVASFLLK